MPGLRQFITLVLICLPLLLSAQDWKLSYRIELKDAELFSIDRRGQLYLSDAIGNIWQYDRRGKFIVNYSPQRQGRLTVLESWASQNIFAFYREFQDYQLFDRFLVPIKDQPNMIPPAGFTNVATLSADNQIWLVDDSDFSLKKFHPARRELSIITPLNLMADVSEYRFHFIREYQNKVFIVDEVKGILVFDNLGNFEKIMPEPGLTWFIAVGNTLQYVRGDQLVMREIYGNGEEVMNLPVNGSKAAFWENRLYILTINGLEVYEKKP